MLLAVVVIGLNLYVQSLGTQAGIQQELSQRLGAPVRIKAVSVTPWGGLTLSGITFAQSGGAAEAGDFLTAQSFELHAGISSLFSHSLVITKVALVSPKISWAQNEDGKWRLPGARKAEKFAVVPSPAGEAAGEPVPAAALPEPSVPAVPAGPAASAEPAASAAAPPAPEPRKKPDILIPEVRRAAVTDGEFRFLDRFGGLVAAFEGVDLRATVQSSASLRGVARVARMSAHDRFFLDTLRSPFSYGPDGIDLPKISARAAGGELHGAFHLQPETRDSPFQLSLKFHDVQADQVVSDAGGSPGMIQGKLEGSFEATGNASANDALSGAGQIVLHDGQVQQYSLLVALGQIFQIEELTQLHLEQAEAKYHLTPGLVTIDELILRSPNIRLTATGTVNFNGKLHLNSQLAINEKVRGHLFKPIRENFQPTAEAGYSAVDFQVSGTLDHPKTNLVNRVVGRDLKDFVSGLLGGKKQDKQKKKKEQQENAAPPSEEATPDESSSPAASAPPPTPTP